MHTVLVCVVILVIVDLDRPQHGMIRVSQRSLERLQAQLAAAPAPGPPADPFAAARAVRYRCEGGRDIRARFRRIRPWR